MADRLIVANSIPLTESGAIQFEGQFDIGSPITEAVVTSVADTASSTLLLASNDDRAGFRIQNTSSAALYIRYGVDDATTALGGFSYRLPQWAIYEENLYTGDVTGIWSSDPGDGGAAITEIVKTATA